MKLLLSSAAALALVVGISASVSAAPINCDGVKYGAGALGGITGGEGSTPGAIVSALAKSDHSLKAGNSLDGALGDKASNVADKISKDGVTPGKQVAQQCVHGPD